MTVVAGKGQGGGEAVFWETTVTVEVILALLGFVPATHQVLVLPGMIDDFPDVLAAEAVLRLLIGNHQSLRGLAHAVDVQGEAFGIHLPHDIDDIGQVPVGNPVAFVLVLRDSRRNRHKGD